MFVWEVVFSPFKVNFHWHLHLQDKFLSRREAIMGEVAKNNEVAEEEEVRHFALLSFHCLFVCLFVSLITGVPLL